MYHYAHYRENNPDDLLPIVQAYPLGLLVTCKGGQFAASHIPFMIDRGPAGALQLLGHLDRSNPQVEVLDGAAVYVVFAGPNTYISPTVYVTRQLPTWNYIAVHVNGHARIETPGQAILDDIERLARQLEPTTGGWTLDKTEERVRKLAPLICRVVVVVDRIEGRFKLSQEKSLADRSAATKHLLKKNLPESRPLLKQLSGMQDTHDAQG
jgi:transcriptional regulator